MRCLLADDNPNDRARIKRVLLEEFPALQFWEVAGREDFDEALGQGGFDLAVMEYRFAWADGFQVLRELRRRFPDRPVVMVTDAGSKEIAVEGMKSGLNDYIPKKDLHRLAAAVREAVERPGIQGVADREQDEETLWRQRDQLAAHARITGAILKTHDLDERLTLILDELMTLFDAHFGGVYFVQEKHVVLRTWRGLSDELRAQVLAYPLNQVPLWLKSTCVVRERLSEEGSIPAFAKRDGIQALTSVPLKLYGKEGNLESGEWLGAVMLGSRRYDAFDEGDLDLLQPFFEQLTLAVDYARYYREAEQRLARLTVLRNIDRGIITRQPIQDILRIVVEHVPRDMGAEAVAISLRERDRLRSHVFMMRLPNGTVIREEAFTISDSLLHWFFQRQEPVIIYDLTRDPRVQMHRQHLQSHSLASYLGVPLVTQEKTIGILHLLTTLPKVFEQEDVEFFCTLAGQAAIAIENSLLFSELQTAEQKYRSIFENAVEGIFQSTPDGRLLMGNPAMARMLGYESPEELIREVTDLQRQLYVDPKRCLELQELLQDRSFVQGFEWQAYRRDGSTMWVSVNARSVRGEGGATLYYEGTMEDISARKGAEQALEAALMSWQNTFEAVQDGVWILDSESRVVRSNGKAERLLGIEPEKLLGRHCYEIIHGTSNFPEQCPLKRLKYTRQREETSFEIKDRRVWVHISTDPIYGASGELQGAVHIISDVTERKQAEEEQRRQLMRITLLNQITRAIAEREDLDSIFRVVLEQLEEHLPVDFGGVLLLDPQSAMLTVAARGPQSQRIAAEVGIPERSAFPVDHTVFGPCVGGQSLSVPDLAQVDRPNEQKLAQAGIRSAFATPLAVEGLTIGILVVARRELDGFSRAEGEFLRMLGEQVALAAHHARLSQELQKAYDDLRQTQHAVMQQERLRALGQMASGIVHDINNGLSPVVGFSELLLMTEKNLSDRARQYLELIHMAGTDIVQIAKRMREFYRQREEREDLVEVGLNDLAQQVIDLLRPRWKDIPQGQGIALEMRTDFDPQLPRLMGVKSEIREALINLILNAVDAMPRGGTLTVRTYGVGLLSGGGADRLVSPPQIVLEISDTGIGMDQETRRRCLEPFFSTKGELGSGLGLSMVFGVMQRHEGDINIQTAPDEGATVRLIFPLVGAGSSRFDRLEPGRELATPSLRILCIDDEPLLRQLMKEMLEQDGHRVETADGGQRGLEALRAAKDRGEPFHVVMSDLGMPFMDGRQVARAVKDESPATPVILLTGWGQRLTPEGDIPNQVDYVLSKPPRINELREALRRVTQLSG